MTLRSSLLILYATMSSTSSDRLPLTVWKHKTLLEKVRNISNRNPSLINKKYVLLINKIARTRYRNIHLIVSIKATINKLQKIVQAPQRACTIIS